MSNQTTEFLQQLKDRLSHLPISEVGKVLSYYSESIEDKLEDGMTEEEIVKSFGSIDSIVSNIEEEITLTAVVKDKISTKAKTKAKEGNATNKVLLVLVLILTSPLWITFGCFLFGVLIAICAILFSIPVVAIATYFGVAVTAIGAILFAISLMITVSFASGLYYFAIGLMCAGVVIALFFPILAGCKKILQLMLLPFKKLKKWLIRS